MPIIEHEYSSSPEIRFHIQNGLRVGDIQDLADLLRGRDKNDLVSFSVKELSRTQYTSTFGKTELVTGSPREIIIRKATR